MHKHYHAASRIFLAPARLSYLALCYVFTIPSLSTHFPFAIGINFHVKNITSYIGLAGSLAWFCKSTSSIQLF